MSIRSLTSNRGLDFSFLARTCCVDCYGNSGVYTWSIVIMHELNQCCKIFFFSHHRLSASCHVCFLSETSNLALVHSFKFLNHMWCCIHRLLRQRSALVAWFLGCIRKMHNSLWYRTVTKQGRNTSLGSNTCARCKLLGNA